MSNKLVPYKFEIIAICHVLDDDDKIVAEQPVARDTPEGLQPVVVFTVPGLTEWALDFEKQLNTLNLEAMARQAEEAPPKAAPNRAQRRSKPKPKP